MRAYLVFVTASISLLMFSIDSTVVAVAFPSFIKEFNTNVLWAGWTISVYFTAITMAMPLAGALSDSLGRKKVFLISLILFTGSSLACGLAPNIHTLIVFRFLQGIGGASFLPTASGLVSDEFPGHRERVIGLFSSIFPIGGIIGPNLGGWVVSRFSWRYIFFINVPIGIILVVFIMALLRDSRVFSRRHIDFLGVSLLSGTIILLMFSLNLIGESFSPHNLGVSALFLASSVVLLLLFFRQEKKDKNPILDMTLLKSRPFFAANLLNIIIGAGVFGTFAFVPLYVTSVHKLSTLVSGMILTPRSVGTIPASAITSFMLRRWGYRRPIVLGLSIVGSVTVLLGQGLPFWRWIGIQWGITEILSFLILLSGIGMGIANPAANNACIELMPEKVATIVGLRGMFKMVGGALGVSVITVILHLSANPTTGFNIAFSSSGLVLLAAIPLAFLVPAGTAQRSP